MSTTVPQEQLTAGQTPPADACLWPLLKTLDWTGEAHHLSDALPDSGRVGDFDTLLVVLGRLDFTTFEMKVESRTLDDGVLPALSPRPNGDVWLLRRMAEPGSVEVFKGRSNASETMSASDLSGTAYVVRSEAADQPAQSEGRFGWISNLLAHESESVKLLFVLSFIINCFALTLPLYLLSVFDLAIGAGSMLSLVTLAGGIAIILCTEFFLREVRSRAIASFAVRTQMFVMASVFQRLLRLPISHIQSASVAGQLNRLRTFESVKDIFSGSLSSSLLDLPFIALFVLMIFVIGGALGWLVVGFIVILAAASAFFIPRARAQTDRAGVTRSESRLLRMDLVRHLPAIRDCSAEDIWATRYRDVVSRQLAAGLANNRVSFAEQTVAQALSAVTGAVVIGFGALRVIDGTLSMGALAAIMAIVWRVLAPIQTALLNLGRVFQAVDTVKQINQLMQLGQETSADTPRPMPRLRGDIALENVGYRSGAQGLPILRGVDMQVHAGQLIVLAGAPGPSRSVVLKLIGSLHQPSVGRIRIDGCDVQQFNIRDLRRSIAYVNDEQIVFSDTLAQNLLFANPLADEERLWQAIEEADLGRFCQKLENGLETDLTERLNTRLSMTISQKIRLARAYLKDASIYLFDEPAKDLDPSGQQAFLAKLQALKGHATVIVRTADPRIFNLADGVAYFQGGQLLGGRTIGKNGGGRDAPALPPGEAIAEKTPI